MKRKWVLLVIVTILVGAFFVTLKDNERGNVMGNILSSIPVVDSISIKDGQTKREIVTLTESDDSFSEMTDIYRYYHDLKRSESKLLLEEEPFIEIQYLKSSDLQFTVSVFQIEDRHISMLPIETTEMGTFSLSYSPEGSNTSYIYAIKELNQLIGINPGLRKLLNIAISKEGE